MEEPTAKTVNFYVPVNLDLNAYPVKYRGPIAYLLDLVHRKTCSWQQDERGFVRLKYEYLTKVIPKEVWSNLLGGYLVGGYEMTTISERYPMVLQTSAYEQGKQCRGYKLTENYREAHLVQCEDKKLNIKLRQLNKEEDQRLLPVHLHLREQFKYLEFDAKLAADLIVTMSPEKETARWVWRDGDFWWREPISTEKYREILSDQAQRLADKEYPFTVDRFGRVHTPITSLPKELRRCLSVQASGKKEPIVWLDMKNSQPLMGVMLAMTWCGSSKMAKSRIRNQRFSETGNPYKAATRRIATRGYVFSNSLQIVSNPPAIPPPPIYYDYRLSRKINKTREIPTKLTVTMPIDLVADLRRCEAGEFYETYMDGEPAETRDKFKVQMFRDVFFGSNSIRSSVKSAFAKSSPSVAGMLHDLKRKQKGRAAWLLQNYEATIFISKICGRLHRELPDVPIFTIHDSIGTTAEYLPPVRSIIMKEFAKLGVSPKLKLENGS